jgi:D-lactate dehydrogenase (cytochrome)
VSLISDLQSLVGPDRVSATEGHRQHHSHDASSHTPVLPDLVVWPETTAEVSAIARYANERCIPLVGWGAGTSIEGNPIPIAGGIVIDFSRMNRILALHALDFQVIVQPGILYKDMNEILARSGLFFAPDPGANASIGGMVANNAAGIRTVKYGATRDNVLALEVVLASGEVIRTGSRSVKQSAGYDLTHLITGSEGTLGLVTEATLKLAPLPEHFSAVIAAFPTVEAAAQAVFEIIGGGLGPSALELLDGATVAILAETGDFDMLAVPNLFMEFTGASPAALEEILALAQEICDGLGCLRFTSGMGREARNRLWSARHHLFETLVRHFVGCTWLLTDSAVPISAYPQLVAYGSAEAAALGLDVGFIGHAGDGNLHTTIFFPPDDPAVRQRAEIYNDRLTREAISLGGTCTGEHGVGRGKAKYLELEFGAGAVAVMRGIKNLLDPNGILNPGKVLPGEGIRDWGSADHKTV